jgi:hypothetical protein
MATRYFNGIDVPRNREAGMEFLIAAASGGHLKARARLASIRIEERKAREAAAIRADEQFLAFRESLR